MRLSTAPFIIRTQDWTRLDKESRSPPGGGEIHLSSYLRLCFDSGQVLHWAEPGYCTKIFVFVMAEERGYNRPLSDYTIPVNDLLE